jgi:hypothetical protein
MDRASVIGLACFLAALTDALFRSGEGYDPSETEDAVLAAAEPAYRPAVDLPLSDDCGCRVADLAESRRRHRHRHVLSGVRFAAPSQCRVIAMPFIGLHRLDLGFADIVLV